MQVLVPQLEEGKGLCLGFACFWGLNFYLEVCLSPDSRDFNVASLNVCFIFSDLLEDTKQGAFGQVGLEIKEFTILVKDAPVEVLKLLS